MILLTLITACTLPLIVEVTFGINFKKINAENNARTRYTPRLRKQRA